MEEVQATAHRVCPLYDTQPQGIAEIRVMLGPKVIMALFI
jgi:hypothetical protein